jgi:signal transduction histidine kinase
VTQVLGNCLELFLPQFELRGLPVKREFSQTLIAVSDPTLLRIIFNNLFDNAACYASSGSEVRVCGAVVGDQIEIRVANMADDLPDNLDRLFEPLFRRETSRNDSESHLGIGLTLSLEAVKAMGGTLNARKAGEGWIEFVLSLPKQAD